MLRALALILAVLALPQAPAQAATIDAVLDAAAATIGGPAGVPALNAAMACRAEGCAACPAGTPATGPLTFDHDDGQSRSAFAYLVGRIAQVDRDASGAVAGTYRGPTFHDVVATDAAPMAALGLRADDLADSAAVYWQSLWEIAAADWRAPTLTVFELPEWGSDRAVPIIAAAKTRLAPLAARLRAALRCDPAMAKLTPQDRSDLGYALHLQTYVLRGLFSATFEKNAEATRAVSNAVVKAVAAKGFDLRQAPLAPGAGRGGSQP